MGSLPSAPAVFVATGAFDVGKTTTLQWLASRHGLRIHGEAHLRALASIRDRSAGHPPERGFTRIDDPDHFCPMCRPRAFAELTLDEQRAIERSARSGDLLERGYLDPIEMLLRNAGEDAPRPSWTPIARYVRVFVFDVMPQLQRPRWGKTSARRVAEAQAINTRLERLYRAAGHEVERVPAGTVEDRGARILAAV